MARSKQISPSSRNFFHHDGLFFHWYVFSTQLLTNSASSNMSSCALVAGFVFISLHHQKQSDWSDKVVQFSRIMPTIWPIIFAAIFGDAIKWFAYWRLERGIQLRVCNYIRRTCGSPLWADTPIAS